MGLRYSAPVFSVERRKPAVRTGAPSAGWAVDQQALTNQRSFLAGVSQNASPAHSIGEARTGTPSQDPTPLRSFPTDQYYSTKVLPAAFPGEHSAFREHVRRESQGQSTMSRPGSQSQNALLYSPATSSISFKIQNMNIVSFAKNIGLHFWVPTAWMVTKVYTTV